MKRVDRDLRFFGPVLDEYELTIRLEARAIRFKVHDTRANKSPPAILTGYISAPSTRSRCAA